ncbi:MAG: cytochrome c maturation protein CcmE [Proteobacteria bacterium]|nr:cytochrome c maturation protein CcmE [Pseudomonadota bacterium]
MTKKQQRIYAIILVVTGIAVAAALTLFALRDNVTFFYTPSDIIGANAKNIVKDRPFRLGGLVMYGTVEQDGKRLRFIVTDNMEDIAVEYEGVVPALFREGQGVVAAGTLDESGLFRATTLMAKHDENYMPPEVAKALKEKGAPHGRVPEEYP